MDLEENLEHLFRLPDSRRKKIIRAMKKRRVGIYSEEGKRWNQLRAAKNRALKDGLEFSISYKDLDWPTVCPVLEIKLERNSLMDSKNNSPSLDRLSPKLGYVKGNVRIISTLANRMKQNATREELEMFVKNIIPYMNGEI